MLVPISQKVNRLSEDVFKEQIIFFSALSFCIGFSLRLEILLGIGGQWCPEIRSKKALEVCQKSKQDLS